MSLNDFSAVRCITLTISKTVLQTINTHRGIVELANQPNADTQLMDGAREQTE